MKMRKLGTVEIIDLPGMCLAESCEADLCTLQAGHGGMHVSHWLRNGEPECCWNDGDKEVIHLTLAEEP